MATEHPPPYDVRAAVAQMGRIVFDPALDAATARTVELGRTLAASILDNHCQGDPVKAATWGEALIVGAASIGALASVGAPAATMRVEPNALRLAINVQAFAGFYLATGASPW